MSAISVITVQPSIEPVTIDEVKLFCRIDGTAEDDLLAEFITAAREAAEAFTRRSFITRTCKATLDRWPSERPTDVWWGGVREGIIGELLGENRPVTLPYPPLIAVTSVTLYDHNDAPTVLAPDEYLVDTAGGRVSLRDGTVLTSLRSQAAFEIVYTAGYGPTADKVPAKARLAIKQAVAAFYEGRTCGGLPEASTKLLDSLRVVGL